MVSKGVVKKCSTTNEMPIFYSSRPLQNYILSREAGLAQGLD